MEPARATAQFTIVTRIAVVVAALFPAFSLAAAQVVAPDSATAFREPQGTGTPPAVSVTNIAQLRSLALQDPRASYQVQLEGALWWANPAQGRFVLQDDSGAEELEMTLPPAEVQPGQRVRLAGNGTISRSGARFRIGARGPVVDNDGVHAMSEKYGAVYLRAGRQPIRVAWFNGVDNYGLEIEYEGPSMSRRRIPDSALFRRRADAGNGPDNLVSGVDWQAYEGVWEALPDFRRLAPHQTGASANFDLGLLTLTQHVALQFSGYLEVPADGLYTFYTQSDDGSQLFVGQPSLTLEVVGPSSLPGPRPVAIGQTLREGEEGQWVEVEGRVTFVRSQPDGLHLELTAGAGRLRVEIADPAGLSPALLPKSRIRVVGFCQSAETLDEQRVPGIILTPGREQLEMLEVAPAFWASPLTTVGSLGESNLARWVEPVVHLSGRLQPSGADGILQFVDATGAITVFSTQPPPPTNQLLECLGELSHTATNLILMGGCWRASAESARAGDGTLPLLTTASEVHRLKREDAQRGHPARIRGVITCVVPERQAFVIQDATRGLYIEDHSEMRSRPPHIGEFLEVEGVTDPSLFAPIINARKIASLGAGQLPEPVRPTWDQLINGSLDAQSVEIQGIVTAVETNLMTLRTSGGMIRVELRVTGVATEALKRYENALIRVRGCLLAKWDYVTHQVQVGDIRIYDADITVDQPAATDLFSSPSKTAAELLLFDPQAGVFQRVKVSGQIVHVREPEYFLMQDGHGLRFVPQKPPDFHPGDLVEVVGFPELIGAASPVLREAVARRIGHAPLPEARMLSPDDLIRTDYDSTRVRIEGRLVSRRESRNEQVLEMRSGETKTGVRTFAARLATEEGAALPVAPGSRLELVGVYAGLGGNRAAGQHIASFELLLNSPADVTVLARPPWWTLERLLVIVGALACVLAATMLWITQLHRQVEERTAELGEQIRERQRVEHQREMEQERTRIAQDLHDELGSGITEISMLAVRMKAGSASEEKRHQHLDQVGDRARELVTALDEIVWAMNPRHDSLASLVSYFSLYADRFLGLANIAWRLEGPAGPAEFVVNSRLRHQLFLAFKEALTNIVRHSRATEVRLSIQIEQDSLRLSIADNGCGLPAVTRTEEMDGVANMRARIESLGGTFTVASEPGGGTSVRFDIPTH